MNIKEIRRQVGHAAESVVLALGLLGCGNAPISEVEAKPTVAIQRPWDVRCAATVEVKRGDTLFGAVMEQAKKQCPAISYEDLQNSVPDPNNIKPGLLTVNDYVGS